MREPKHFFCPACRAAGQKSHVDVTPNDIRSESYEPEEFYDESGNHHFHEPDPEWLQFTCSNGHRGSITPPYHCESCEFSGPGAIRIFSEGKDGVIAAYSLNGDLVSTACQAGSNTVN